MPAAGFLISPAASTPSRPEEVAAKTAAGEWALQNGLCPVEQSLRKALEVRKHPLLYRDTLAYQKWAASLGPDIQSYADVLEAEL